MPETEITFIDMKAQLEELTQQTSSLQKAIAAAETEAMTSLVQNILTAIDEHGFERKAVLEKLNRQATKRRSSPIEVVLMHDPEVPGQTYSRGVYPAWMKERMAQLGFDATNKEHRKAYRTQHLVPVVS